MTFPAYGWDTRASQDDRVCRSMPRLLSPLLCAFILLIVPTVCSAKTYLTITSEPSRASVEIDGIVVGKTPYSVEIPGSYVHGGRSVFTKFLRHQMHLRLVLDGYLTKGVDLANGPTPFITLKSQHQPTLISTGT